MKKVIILFTVVCVFFFKKSHAQNVGIGIPAPLTKLHVYNGASGATPYTLSPLAVESNSHTYINLLSPAASETGIFFGQPTSSSQAGIIYNNITNPNGFQFRNNGNQTRMVIINNGNVGIGTTIPGEKLEVAGNAKANNFFYTTPKTFYYSLSGMDFRNERSTDTAGVNLGSGGAYMQNAVAGKRLVAPVHLPQGATMVNMTVYIYDVSASQNLQAVFHRKTITSNFFPNNIGVVASSGSPGVTTAYTTAVNGFDNVVDNSLYTYYIAVNTESASGFWTSNMEIRAVVIEYTQTGAQ